MMTRHDALNGAAEVLCDTTAALRTMDTEQIVRAAWTPTGPTPDQLRQRLAGRAAA